MTDILKTLRDMEAIQATTISGLCGEAADEIEDLRSVLTQVRRDLSEGLIPEADSLINAALSRRGIQ